ncbi:MAG: hypothetical protein E7616_03810 [Ruminococcaceae bacterium]|nr:hypothetical protein [Oscillospiraceae bacterium]
MTNKKTTKRALVLSLLAMVLSVSMLMGTTYAWFTDSVGSVNNIIKSGNLDVELEYFDEDAKEWTIVDEETNVFSDELWEPGHTQVVYLKVSNLGSLSLKYALDVNIYSEIAGTNVADETFKLSDYIYYGAVENTTEKFYETRADARKDVFGKSAKLSSSYVKVGSILPDEDSEYVTLVVYMPETVGNEANHKTGTPAPEIKLGINLFATQYVYEEDSFNEYYDGLAFVPVASVNRIDATTVESTLGMNGPDSDIELDTAFRFATTDSYDEAVKSGYRYWHADFVVSANNDVAAGSMALAGYYSAFSDDYNDGKWVALVNDGETISAGQEIRLLDLMLNGGSMNYQELCQWVPEFLCGAADLDGTNKGTTLTVELRLYETTADPATNTGNKNEETGNYIIIGTYTHTFGVDAVRSDAELAARLAELKGNSEFWNKEVVINLAANNYAADHIIDQYPEWNGVVGAGASHNNLPSLNGSENVLNLIFVAEDGVQFTGNVTVNGFGNAQNGFTNAKATTTFRNVTFDASNSVESNGEDSIALYVVAAANNVTFENCTFQNATHVTLGGSGSNAVGTVSFTGCTFENGGTLSGYVNTLNVADTTVNNQNGFINKSTAGTVTVDNCDITCGKYFFRTATNGTGANLVAENTKITVNTFEAENNLVNFRGSSESATFTGCTITEGYSTNGVDANSILTIH